MVRLLLAMRQGRSAHMQRLKAEVDARRDNAPDIGAIFGHDIEIGCSSEIDHDNIAAMPVKGGGCVGQTVRAGPCSRLDPGRDRQQAFRFANDQRAAVEIPVAQDPQIEHNARNS